LRPSCTTGIGKLRHQPDTVLHGRDGFSATRSSTASTAGIGDAALHFHGRDRYGSSTAATAGIGDAVLHFHGRDRYGGIGDAVLHFHGRDRYGRDRLRYDTEIGSFSRGVFFFLRYDTEILYGCDA